MNQEEFDFMRLPQKPSRMTVQQAGWYMGFNENEVKVLVRHKLLKPLGNPAPNAARYFSRILLDQLGTDPKWLDKASASLGQHWRDRNEKEALRRKGMPAEKPLQKKIRSLLTKNKKELCYEN